MAGIADSDHEETVVFSESKSYNPQRISRSRLEDYDSNLVSVSSWNEMVHSDHLSNSDLSAAVKRLTLTGVKIHDKELGQGGTGTVYEADYNGIPCAAKRINPIQLRYLYTEGNRYFLQECLLHSKLKHKNIVKMLGVSYDVTDQSSLNPFLIMELMKYTLAQLINEIFIPMYVKLSILQDVSAGLCYLHSHNIIHCGINPFNILLTTDLVAKIGDFGDSCRLYTVWGQRSSPWGTDINSISNDVAYFGKVACNLITQSQHQHKLEPRLPSRIAYTIPSFAFPDFSDNTAYKISEGPLRKLIESCLNNESFLRPTISVVHKTIIDIKKGIAI